jgi:hypothetical protein
MEKRLLLKSKLLQIRLFGTVVLQMGQSIDTIPESQLRVIVEDAFGSPSLTSIVELEKMQRLNTHFKSPNSTQVHDWSPPSLVPLS